MMMKGPEKTGKFTGFGMKLTAGTSRPGAPTAVGGAPKPAARAGRPGSAAAPRSAAVSLFRDSMEDDEKTGKSTGLPSWSKPNEKAMQAQRDADALVAQDPTVFQYDEVIDEMRGESGFEGPEAVRTEALTQKKRVGLTLREGSEAVRTGSTRQPKYVEKVVIATDRRRVEQQIVEDRMLAKDKDKNKGCETFITSGFKDELKKRKKFEEELERQDMVDQRKAASQQENGLGFASMYRNLLNDGLATSRGGEKIREQAPALDGAAPILAAPRYTTSSSSVKKEEDVEEDTQVKEEVDAEVKQEAKLELKEEKQEGAAADHGVADAAVEEGPQAKKAKLAAEKEQREEKTMSARERYLARKKAAEAS